jgi:hypothetical protein
MCVPPDQFVATSNGCEDNIVIGGEWFIAINTFAFLDVFQVCRCRLFVIYGYYFHLRSIYYRMLDVNQEAVENSRMWLIS